jgi:hypothetical protein
LRLQSHKTGILAVIDQQVLEYQALHPLPCALGPDHFLRIPLDQIVKNICPTHLLVPGKLKQCEIHLI